MKSLTKLKREIIFDKFNGHCAYCGCVIEYNKFHVDHIIPLRRGYKRGEVEKGTSHIDNLFPACVSCNTSKSDFKIETWRKELELKKMRIKRDIPTYNLLLRFGCIIENNIPITFYFEKYGRLD